MIFFLPMLFFGMRFLFFSKILIHPELIQWIAVTMVTVLPAIAVYQYLNILKFARVPTPFFGNENRKLLEDFLQSQQLAVYRHPQAPEVYQIISKPLGNSSYEMREVMIFIADDKRILINSHFVDQTFSAFTPPSRNYRKMANRLKEWIKIHCSTNLQIENVKM